MWLSPRTLITLTTGAGSAISPSHPRFTQFLYMILKFFLLPFVFIELSVFVFYYRMSVEACLFVIEWACQSTIKWAYQFSFLFFVNCIILLLINAEFRMGS